MKVLKISLLLLIGFSLMSGICYGQTIEEYYEKGMEYSVAGKFEEAQQEFKKALEIDPFYIAVENCLEATEDVLEQKIKIETALYLFNGIVYANKGMLDEAIALYQKAIEINPEYAGTYYNLGAVYFSKGMLDEAAAELKKAIEINPKYADAHNNLVIVYYFMEEYELAVKHCDIVIELGFVVHPTVLELLEPHR